MALCKIVRETSHEARRSVETCLLWCDVRKSRSPARLRGRRSGKKELRVERATTVKNRKDGPHRSSLQ